MKTVLGTTDHQGTANSKHSITSPPLEQLILVRKTKVANTGKDVENQESLHTSVISCSHYGRMYAMS